MKNQKIFNLLASYYALYVKLHSYHWNVEGANFVSIHELLEKQYDVIADEVDEIAEQIRKLGEKVEASLTNFAKNSIVLEPNEKLSAKEMLLDLLNDNKKIVVYIKELMSIFDGDEALIGTKNLLDGLLETREKDIWFLEMMTK